MKPSKTRLFGRALLTPIPLLVLLIGITIAAITHDTQGNVLLVCSITAACAFAWMTASKPSFARDAGLSTERLEAGEVAHRREMMIETLEAESRVRVKEIIRYQREIAAEMECLGDDLVSPELSDIALQTGRLVERAISLSQKRGELLSYLRKTKSDSVNSRIDDLKTRLDCELSDRDKTQVRIALEASEKELVNVQAVTDTASRILLDLDSIAASFAGMRSEFARLRSENVENWLSAIESLKATVGGIKGFADSLDSALDGISWTSENTNA